MDNENPNQNTQPTQGQGKTFTQADLDAAIEARLQRERAKFADYDALKDKAAKYDEAQEAAKTELQKAQDLAANYKAQLDARDKELAKATARSKVAEEMGVPANLLSGETEEACKAQATALLQWRGGPKSVPNRSVDHMIGGNGGAAAKNDFEAGLLRLSGELFQAE